MENKKLILLKKMSTKEYGTGAIVGILGGIILSNRSSIILIKILGDIIFFTGIIFLFVYIFNIFKKRKQNIFKTTDRIYGFIKNNYKSLTIAVVIIVAFSWYGIRPSFIKKSCYHQATATAIKIVQDEESRQFLYDRDHWREYRKSDIDYGSPQLNALLSDNSYGGRFDSKLTVPTFPDNLNTNTEPAYIQENLDKIAKEDSFYDEDYNKYYKWCLDSKGL